MCVPCKCLLSRVQCATLPPTPSPLRYQLRPLTSHFTTLLCIFDVDSCACACERNLQPYLSVSQQRCLEIVILLYFYDCFGPVFLSPWALITFERFQSPFRRSPRCFSFRNCTVSLSSAKCMFPFEFRALCCRIILYMTFGDLDFVLNYFKVFAGFVCCQCSSDFVL